MFSRWPLQHPSFQVWYDRPELKKVRLRSVEHLVLPSQSQTCRLSTRFMLRYRILSRFRSIQKIQLKLKSPILFLVDLLTIQQLLAVTISMSHSPIRVAEVVHVP